MRTVGLVANTEKPGAARVARATWHLLRRAGWQVVVETQTARLLRRAPPAVPLRELASLAELLVVLGGDGTILRVARDTHGASVPILSVNLGTLGFLTTILQKDLAAAIEKLQRGQYRVVERVMLEADVVRGGKVLSRHRALNDVVITRGAFSRLVRIEVTVDGELLTTYTCDGLIVSTPTGSTAYSLSAGGPIISLNAPAFVITPICPHTLSNRSVIVGQESRIRATLLPQPVRAGSKEQIRCVVTVDGQEAVHLRPLEAVEARCSPHRFRMIALPGHSYFEVLRHKLNWSGSNI